MALFVIMSARIVKMIAGEAGILSRHKNRFKERHLAAVASCKDQRDCSRLAPSACVRASLVSEILRADGLDFKSTRMNGISTSRFQREFGLMMPALAAAARQLGDHFGRDDRGRTVSRVPAFDRPTRSSATNSSISRSCRQFRAMISIVFEEKSGRALRPV